jgi:hypothetical protein
MADALNWFRFSQTVFSFGILSKVASACRLALSPGRQRPFRL